MTSEPVSDAPPLPHLSGRPPIPRVVKRAYTALAFSCAAWFITAVSIGLFIVCVNHKQTPVTVPLLGWRTTLENIAALLLVGSGAFGFLGSVVGLTARKITVGKAAAILSSVQFVPWLALIIAAIVAVARE